MALAAAAVSAFVVIIVFGLNSFLAFVNDTTDAYLIREMLKLYLHPQNDRNEKESIDWLRREHTSQDWFANAFSIQIRSQVNRPKILIIVYIVLLFCKNYWITKWDEIGFRSPKVGRRFGICLPSSIGSLLNCQRPKTKNHCISIIHTRENTCKSPHLLKFSSQLIAKVCG